MSIPKELVPHFQFLKSQGWDILFIGSALKNTTSESLISQKDDENLLFDEMNDSVKKTNIEISETLAELKRRIREQDLNSPQFLENLLIFDRNFLTKDLDENFNDKEPIPCPSDDEEIKSYRSFSEMPTSHRFDSQEEDFPSNMTTLRRSEKQFKQNQNDALKIISTQFTSDCKDQVKHKADFNNLECPSFTSYFSLETIIKDPKYNWFAKTLWNFLEGEIEKYKEHYQGLFRDLETRGYMNSKIDHILHTLNDLMKLNHPDPTQPFKPLSRNFLNFDDGSARKNMKTIYSKKIGGGMEIEEEKGQNKSKSEFLCKFLPPANQNDALKFFSTKLQEYCSETGETIKPPKFLFYQNIEEKILKNKRFPEFLKIIVDFLNNEIEKARIKTVGLFSGITGKGYSDNTVNRIMQVWNELVYINNEINVCELCDAFFSKRREKLQIKDWRSLGFAQTSKAPKTVFTQWVSLIKENNCQGFDPTFENAFKLPKSSRGIKRR